MPPEPHCDPSSQACGTPRQYQHLLSLSPPALAHVSSAELLPPAPHSLQLDFLYCQVMPLCSRQYGSRGSIENTFASYQGLFQPGNPLQISSDSGKQGDTLLKLISLSSFRYFAANPESLPGLRPIVEKLPFADTLIEIVERFGNAGETLLVGAADSAAELLGFADVEIGSEIVFEYPLVTVPTAVFFGEHDGFLRDPVRLDVLFL